MPGIGELIWIFFLLTMLQPLVSRRLLEAQRMRLLHRLERKRGSRAILLVHRQETMGLLGFPLLRYLDIQDSEEVLRAIRMTTGDVPIDLILHTPGGLVLAADQIARALRDHPAKVTVFVPHYAMSGGTLLALAADEIVMDPHAVLGPVDPQIGQRPAASILRAVQGKPVERVSDQTLIEADIARMALEQVRETVRELLKGKMEPAKAEEVAEVLSQGSFTHDFPITCERARSLGLRISCDLPPEIHEIMALHPQPPNRRPSVYYLPLPYGEPARDGPARAGGGH
ncbi:MAG: hypothetical protein KatS3mg102_0394 [Planctomycetota bacterium]|nr:MAG: hypothetical protein KatS3mg102_0394 [Planctomycetota bacterium]